MNKMILFATKPMKLFSALKITSYISTLKYLQAALRHIIWKNLSIIQFIITLFNYILNKNTFTQLIGIKNVR